MKLAILCHFCGTLVDLITKKMVLVCAYIYFLCLVFNVADVEKSKRKIITNDGMRVLLLAQCLNVL